MTAVAVFGCSWTVGVGVLPTDTFGARLADKLSSTTFTNLGIQGSSNSRSVLQLLDYIKHKDISVENSIAVFLVTTSARECVIADPSRQCRTPIIDLTSGQTDDVTQSWITHFSSIPNINFILHKNILSMQSICRQYNIRDYYIVGWDQLVVDQLIARKLPGVDTTKIYHKSCAQLFGYENLRDFAKRPSNQHVRMCGHPNELGHELIAQTLYNWITQQNNVQSKI
jgi:hypothetical protein